MPNYSGVWDLRQQGVAVKGGLWPLYPSGIGVFMGGYGAADEGTIDYWTIASTGNAIDFGDLLAATTGGAQSNGHGGIS